MASKIDSTLVLTFVTIALRFTHGWRRWAPLRAYKSFAKRDNEPTISVEEIVEIFHEANRELVPGSLRDTELQIAQFQVADFQVAKQIEVEERAVLACLDLQSGEITLQ